MTTAGLEELYARLGLYGDRGWVFVDDEGGVTTGTWPPPGQLSADVQWEGARDD